MAFDTDVSKLPPARRQRRTSPSVSVPNRLPSPATTTAIRRLLISMARTASISVASGGRGFFHSSEPTISHLSFRVMRLRISLWSSDTDANTSAIFDLRRKPIGIFGITAKRAEVIVIQASPYPSGYTASIVVCIEYILTAQPTFLTRPNIQSWATEGRRFLEPRR